MLPSRRDRLLCPRMPATLSLLLRLSQDLTRWRGSGGPAFPKGGVEKEEAPVYYGEGNRETRREIMEENRPAETTVYEDSHFLLQGSEECGIPGYLVLRMKGKREGAGGLTPQESSALGAMISRAVRAIDRTVVPERVYILSFCEVDSQLHFHLFPRTGWLLREYWRAHGGEGEAVDGPALFQWAKRTFLPGAVLPTEEPTAEALLPALRGAMEGRL